MKTSHLLFIWATTVILFALPVILHSDIPAIDIPNHMARQHIGTGTSAVLQSYYDFSFSFSFNSAADAIWHFAAQYITSERNFARLMALFYISTFTGSAMILGRVVLGRWHPMPLFSALFLYGDPFFVGTQNYYVTMPFVLLAIALALGTESLPAWKRSALLTPVALLILNMHVLAFVGFAAAFFGRELHRLHAARNNVTRHLTANIILGLPFVIAVGGYILATHQAGPNLFGSDTRFGSPSDRVSILLSSTRILTASDDFVTQMAGLWILPALIVLLHFLLRTRAIALNLSPLVVGPTIMLLSLCLLLPSQLTGVSFVPHRYPAITIAVILAGLDIRILSKRAAITALAFIAVIGGFALLRIERLFARHSTDVADLTAVLQQVTPGSRILPVTTQSMFNEPRMWHIQAYSVVLRQAFVPTLFQGVNSLVVRPEWEEHASLRLLIIMNAGIVFEGAVPSAQSPTFNGDNFWLDWEKKFTHVLSVDPLPEDLVREQGLKKLAAEGRFELYGVPVPSGN